MKIILCDLGCGPGLYTTEFAKKGADVTGIDFSQRSIDFAKKIASKENLDIKYLYENYIDIQIEPKFDLVILIQRDFSALSKKQRAELLKKIRTMLNKDGLVLFDICSESLFNKTQEENTFTFNEVKDTNNYWSNFWSDNPHFVFNNVFKYDNKKLFLSKYSVFEKKRFFEIYN